MWVAKKNPPGRDQLPSCTNIWSHSDEGFGWGYKGRGAAQLALALLYDALVDRDLALRHYQEFKRVHVATWGKSWSITPDEIRFFVLERATHTYRPGPPKFPSGQIVGTASVLTEIPGKELNGALARHLSGDWGDVGEEDWEANEEALRCGTRLFSVYRLSSGQAFWIITEADRSVTTALLPSEY